MNLTQPLDDHSPFPFGMYKRIRMIDIPNSYLLWCTEQDWLEEKYPEVWDYIEDNIDVLKQEQR